MNKNNNTMKMWKNHRYIAAGILAAGLFLLIVGNRVDVKKEVVTIRGGDEIANAMGEASLSWNANKEEDIAGYKIYYGTKTRTGNCPFGGYLDKVDVGMATSYKMTNLKKGATYYFSTTSYDKGGRESCFSEEVNKSIQ